MFTLGIFKSTFLYQQRARFSEREIGSIRKKDIFAICHIIFLSFLIYGKSISDKIFAISGFFYQSFLRSLMEVP